MFDIKALNKLSDKNNEKKIALERVKEIFFLSSSKKTFLDEEKKEAFFKRWCGDYIYHYPAEFFILFEEDRVLGYLSGCQNTVESFNHLNVPGLEIFKDFLPEFPAHFHINFHPDARGRGLGSFLLNHYIEILKANKVKGVHLITSPEAPNVSFYERLSFSHCHTREFNQTHLFGFSKI